MAAGAALAGTLIGGTLGLGNGSTGWGYGQGETIGIGNGSGYSNSGASGSSSSWNNSYGQSISSSSDWGNSRGGSTSQYNVYGSEASARDILRANEANAVQQKMWEEQARFNAEEAQINRDFQEYMANTAYQRAVVDLIRAGLNPILAVGNMGAMTPVGAQASSGLAGAHKAQSFADAESSSRSWSSSSWGGSSSSKSYNQSSGGSKSSYNATSASRNKYANMTYGYNYNMYNNSNNIANVAKSAISKIGDMMRNPVPTPTH